MNIRISTDDLQFKILAPSSSEVPQHFRQSKVDTDLHAKLIFDTQLLRGLTLKEECGSTGIQLHPDGRHFQEVDAESWHVLLQNGAGCILGCARYRPLRGNLDELGAYHSALAHSQRYGPVFRSVMERLLARARKDNKQCGEAGGWVLRREIRGSTAALNIALMTFSLAEHLNCGMGIITATRMHHSASMLCRIGAQRVPDLPAYYEPKYGSIIELLQFDVSKPNQLYANRLDRFRTKILEIPVVSATNVPAACPSFGLARLARAVDPRISAAPIQVH